MDKQTTFTSIGSHESGDQSILPCCRGCQPDEDIFCDNCNEYLCPDCYKYHQMHFHHNIFQIENGVTISVPHGHNDQNKKCTPNKATKRVIVQTRKPTKKDRKTDTVKRDNGQIDNTALDIKARDEVIRDMTVTDNITKDSSMNHVIPDAAITDLKTGMAVTDDKNLRATDMMVTRLNSVKDICCIKSPGPCRITGIILVEKTLIITDFSNRSVKAIEANNNQIISEVNFETGPWDLTAVNNSQVVVTLTNDKKIAFLSLDTCKQVDHEILTVTNQISVNGYCDGIVYSNNTIITSFIDPGKIEILDLNGNVLKKFEKDNKGTKLFQEPRHVAVSPDGQTLYVSDFHNNSVICITIDGTVISQYTDNDLKGPESLSVDHNGKVYVCGGSSSNIHLITAKCEKLQVVLTKADKLQYPQSLCCSSLTKKIYIGMDGNRNILVFSDLAF